MLLTIGRTGSNAQIILGLSKAHGYVLKRIESQTGFRRGLEHVMDFRQYSVFGQPHGYCGWYSR